MVEMICAGGPPDPAVVREVADVDSPQDRNHRADGVAGRGRALRRARRAADLSYRADIRPIYLDRLDVPVDVRAGPAGRGRRDLRRDEVPGARAFLAGLADRGLRLYLASGTDHHYLDGIRRARRRLISRAASTARSTATSRIVRSEIIERILTEQPARRRVAGCRRRPVEIREAVSRAALALGVASDEVAGSG